MATSRCELTDIQLEQIKEYIPQDKDAFLKMNINCLFAEELFCVLDAKH